MIITKPAAPVSRLDHCERIIENGFGVFIAVGEALAEIRDSKLYKDSHKTFEAYCKARWDLGRSRAYELIDQAKVTKAITEAGVDLSGAPDISGRDAAALKADLPAAAETIKAKVDAGESPAKALVETATAAREAKQEKKPEPTPAPSAKKQAEPLYNGLSADDRIKELEESESFLMKRVAELEAKLATYERLDLMYRDWTEGGWDKVIQEKDALIAEIQRTAGTRIERESTDKQAWANSAKAGWKKAREHGYSRDEVIDLSEGGNG